MNALIDLPLAVSPVVVGLALILVYGHGGWFGGWLAEHGIQVIFSIPGMVLATIFVSLPFVVREVVPVLREIGTEQEQAAVDARRHLVADLLARHAAAIRWGLTYGIVLDDGAGARRVRRRQRRLREALSGETETLPCSSSSGSTNST